MRTLSSRNKGTYSVDAKCYDSIRLLSAFVVIKNDEPNHLPGSILDSTPTNMMPSAADGDTSRTERKPAT